MTRRRLASLLVLLIALSAAFNPAMSQERSGDAPLSSARSQSGMDPTARSAVTPEFLDNKIKETETASDLDEALKAKLTEQYRKALSQLEAESALEAKTAAYTQALETAPARTAAIREQLTSRDAAAPPEAPAIPDDLSITELEQRLAKTQADAAAVGAKLSELEKQLESNRTRPAEARQAIIEAKRELEEVEAELALPPQEGQPEDLAKARRWAQEARRQSLRANILMLDQELLSQAVRVELLEAERDKAANDLQGLKAEARALETRLSALRQRKAEEAADEAKETQRQAAGKHPLIQELARRNAELSDELTTLTEELNRFAGQQEQIEEQTRRITEDFRSARQRMEVAGLTQALGQVLIDQRNQLPNLRHHEKAAVTRAQAITDATLRQIRYREERRRLKNLDDYLSEAAGQGMPADLTDADFKELRKLADRRGTLLDQAMDADDAYLRILGEVDYASSQLTGVVREYDGFLAERLLWVRSSGPVSLATFVNLPRAVLWGVSPANWVEVAQVLLYEAPRSPLSWLLVLTAVGLQWKTRALRQRLLATATYLRRVRTDSILYTLEAVGLSLLMAAPLSLLFVAFGLELYGSLEATDFTKAIGQAAISVSLGLYFLRAFRVLCMSGGVADRHFQWTGEVLKLLRRNFDWLLVVLVPLGFIASACYNHADITYSGSLGRLSLIALMLGLAAFFARVLNPQRGAPHNLLQASPGGWFNRLKKLWYPLVVGMPLALSLLTAAGYVYTSGILLRSLLSSMYLVLGITVVHQLIIRWLVLTSRRLALQAALDRRAARANEETRQGEAVAAPPPQAEDTRQVDLASLDEQTRRLINTVLFLSGAVALWGIWSQVLPAFGIFEQVALWHQTGVVDGEEKIIPVTLADIGSVALIALIAFVAARNLPALLEILLLSRMSFSSGSRYAIKTLTGYTITAAAALTAFSTLGLSWGQVQWLVAALGVGIGFGLQEIVANFISGLIILFERPVRVGDVVTIGDTTGSVSKIRIRATTIRNWDKQELLVPNKEFITGRLLNWTLSDNLNRIVITVGVDYGADVPLALKLLEEAARENGHVLADPEPRITFEGFGDNALTLVLRCYLDSLDDRLMVISELHQSINAKFQAAGISIAFPQRDVHLSTAQPLDVRVTNAWPGAVEPASKGSGGGSVDPGR